MLIFRGHRYRKARRDNDAVPVPEEYQGTVYYHGTSSEELAKKILKEGKLCPGKDYSEYEDKAWTDPMPGRVYFSPSLSYTLSYVCGHHCQSELKYLLEEGGRYGYLFVIPSSLLEDILPDEDALGRMMCQSKYKWILQEFKNIVDENYHEFDEIVQHIMETRYEIYVEDQEAAGEVADPLEEYMEYESSNYNFFDELRDCAYPEIAVAGKFLLRNADDELVTDILECGDFGESLSHEGEVPFSEVWRFDKNFAPKLNEDGFNFFDLAERVA